MCNFKRIKTLTFHALCFIMYSIVYYFIKCLLSVLINFYFCFLSYYFNLSVSLVRSRVHKLRVNLYYALQVKPIGICQLNYPKLFNTIIYIDFDLYYLSNFNMFSIIYQIFYVCTIIELIDSLNKFSRYCNPFALCSTLCYSTFILNRSHLHCCTYQFVDFILNPTLVHCHYVCTITASYKNNENKSTNTVHYLQCTHLIINFSYG